MNSILKRYVSYKNKLLEFFQHFDRLVEDRRCEELRAYFRASNARSRSTGTIVPSNIGSTNEIKGIETKEKLTRRSSKGLQSSLEKAIKKRKTKGKQSLKAYGTN
ncbi:hypothetical protein M9H77_27772 [Catharanthus roseus]|uniref:Uncharacterized protein n=1 Tax=Catharanthus roseus TaxID=4058 RepID=A0ACC0AFL5_CATRO|nr:hypothetical protein M9H77_27772 [Catharanthus roseus]